MQCRWRTGLDTECFLGWRRCRCCRRGFASLAQALRVKVNERTRIPVAVSSPCSTEPVLIEGTSHVIVSVTQDQSGGSHAVFHSTLIGQGVGASSDRYIVQVRTNAHGKSDLDSADNSTVVTYFHVVRQGETTTEDDFTLRVTSYLTQNASGEPTATFDNVAVECR